VYELCFGQSCNINVFKTLCISPIFIQDPVNNRYFKNLTCPKLADKLFILFSGMNGRNSPHIASPQFLFIVWKE